MSGFPPDRTFPAATCRGGGSSSNAGSHRAPRCIHRAIVHHPVHAPPCACADPVPLLWPPPCTARSTGVREVEEWMSRASGVPLDELRPYMFLLRDRDATGHLLRVSGGLDSLVMGEGQILAQVKQVHKVGQNCPGFGRHLNGLFKQAVTAGKRVRSETSISSGAVSVSSAAAELAQLKLPSHSFDDAKVCIIGAGKMSRLLVKHLSSKGCKRVTVLNRRCGLRSPLQFFFFFLLLQGQDGLVVWGRSCVGDTCACH